MTTPKVEDKKNGHGEMNLAIVRGLEQNLDTSHDALRQLINTGDKMNDELLLEVFKAWQYLELVKTKLSQLKLL